MGEIAMVWVFIPLAGFVPGVRARKCSASVYVFNGGQ